MLILGLETSCDETGVALYDTERGLLAEALHSQVDLHAVYGGVVPEIAARAHAERVDLVIERALDEASTRLSDLDAIAVTAGPGLIGGVMAGVMTAKGLAAGCGNPLIGVIHLEGHALTPRLTDGVAYPYLLLLVSGGHCQFLEVRALGQYRRIGGTIDDAPGEAFDKVARFMELGYPGGPVIDRLSADGDPAVIAFPRAMANDGWNFSFSGLKTSVVNHVRKHPDAAVPDVAASFQEAVADVLVLKARRAAKEFGAKGLCLAGGVAANSRLREKMAAAAATDGLRAFLPSRAMCTDNAAMIATAAWWRFNADGPSGLDLGAKPNLKLDWVS